MNRKLKKKEVMILSRILNDVEFKYYVDYLMKSKINKFLESSDKKSIIVVVFTDILAFIVQNIHKAESNIDDLLMSYYNLSNNQIEDLDIDEYTDKLKDVFLAGIPKILNSFINVGDLKKNLTEMK